MTTLPLEQIQWNQPVLPRTVPDLSPEWEREIRKVVGQVPPHVAALTACPWLIRTFLEVRQTRLVHIPYRLGDLIALVVSQDSSCRHCYGAMRTMLRFTGYSEAQVRKIEEDLHQSDLPEHERRALEYVRSLSRANPRAGAEDVQRLREVGYRDEQIAEIGLHAASWVNGNRIATLLAIAPDLAFERMIDAWYAPLVRVMVRIKTGRRPMGRPQALPPEATLGALGSLFTKLDGIPLATTLAKSVVTCLDSEILPRRTKLYLIAVIARTLMCSTVEREVEPLLAREGVDESQLGEVLRSLAAPSLDEREAKMIPLARETVRYNQPAHVQAKMRDLSDEVSLPEFLEFVGVVALANGMGRLTAVLSGL